VIRALRRWLLGAEPEGPPLRDDPLYRYEARRHWTWRRYLGLGLVLAAWVIFVPNRLVERFVPYPLSDFELAWMLLLSRAPLSFVASTGAALCIVPERVSGQLEQFILTPVDSWRFCLARLAGRLRGLMLVWLGVLLVPVGMLLGACMISGRQLLTGGDGNFAGRFLPLFLVFLALHLDLAAMLVVDAAVGMRFSATSSSATAALVKTYLTNFVLTPLAMYVCAAMAGLGGALCCGEMWPFNLVAFGVCALVVRLWLAALAVRASLRDARRAMDRTFYQPEDRA
jgi:hypothetical protein